MSPLLIIFMLTAVIGLAGVCSAIVLSLRLQRLKLQLGREQEAAPADPATAASAENAFQTPLLRATLQQRLRQHQPQPAAPDKYRKASELAALGMSAQQIADLLALPPGEARQLISLSRARHNAA